jgi:hypothetical protein
MENKINSQKRVLIFERKLFDDDHVICYVVIQEESLVFLFASSYNPSLQTFENT